jgi:hypothetical protein
MSQSGGGSERFCGFDRDADDGPVLIPVRAWWLAPFLVQFMVSSIPPRSKHRIVPTLGADA